MSKLYTTYLNLKAKDTSDKTVYLFKSGIFYVFLEGDAKKMSPLLSLKLCPLNETVVKCAFPATHLQKYLTLLRENSL